MMAPQWSLLVMVLVVLSLATAAAGQRRRQQQRRDADRCECECRTCRGVLALAGANKQQQECQCCAVCARAGDSCQQEHHPCDAGLRLTCVNDVCAGAAGLQVGDVTFNTTTVKWRNGSWVAVRFSKDVGAEWNDWRREQLPVGSSVDSFQIHSLQPNTTYFVTLESSSSSSSDGDQQQQQQHASEVVVVTTPDDEALSSLAASPHLIITGRTPSSVSVAWDDFKPPSYSRGYVLEYRVPHNQVMDTNWTRIQTNNTPMTTVDNLQPNTRYSVRVSIWGEEQDTLGANSEVINVTTVDGCIKGNRTFRVDDEWFEGCDLRCACRSNASLECEHRCQPPLFHADQHVPADPRCTVLPDSKDSCCVSVQCDTAALAEQHQPPKCPPPVAPSADWEDAPCVSTCHSASDCSLPGQLCCPSTCGATRCTNASAATLHESDACINVICGPRAECHVTDGFPKCQCADGTEGDPNDYTRGCTATVASSPNTTATASGCNFKNMSYSPGERFYDGCDYRCMCNLRSEIECEARCPGSESLNGDPTCRLVTDPEDTCCHVILCGSHPNAFNALKDPNKKDKLEFAVASDGCFYQNKTYRRSEQILEGCSKNCSCRGDGFISCMPRCPLTSPPGAGCITLPDPLDSCCNVTVCNGTVPSVDVMRNTSFHHHNQLLHLDHPLLHGESSTTVLTNLSATPGGDTLITSTETTSTSSSGDHEVATTTPTTTDHKDLLNELGLTGNDFPSGGTKRPDTKDKTVVNSVVDERVASTTKMSAIGETDGSVDDQHQQVNGTQVKTISDALHFLAQHTSEEPVGHTTVKPGMLVDQPSATETSTKEGDSTMKSDDSADMTTTQPLTVVTDFNSHGTLPFSANAVSTGTFDGGHSSTASVDLIVEKKERGRKLEDKHTMHNSDIVCEVDGQQLQVGAEVNDACRRLCRCLEGGKTQCTPFTCPYQEQPEVSSCLLWDYDINFRPTPGNCCAQAVCISKVPVAQGAPCDHLGRRFSHLEPVPSSQSSCDKQCRCTDGNVTCEARCPFVADLPPPNLVCPLQGGGVELALLPGDECCRQWTCKQPAGGGGLGGFGGQQEEETDSLLAEFIASQNNKKHQNKRPSTNPFLVTVAQEEQGDAIFANGGGGANPPSFDPSSVGRVNFPTTSFGLSSAVERTCESENGAGVRRLVGEQWEEQQQSCQTRKCTCVLLQNGSAVVECTGGCSPVEKYLEPSEGCPTPVLVTPDDPCFCPYVVCSKPDQAKNVQNLTAVALNATSVRVSLAIPQLYVGLLGVVELLYTDDVTRTNTSTWDREIFSHRDDLFSETRMQHDLQNLQPDTTYYVKANVMIRGHSNQATSNVITVHTPELPTPPPPPAAPTSTLPSHLALNPVFKPTDRLPTSVRLTWRPLSPIEKRVVDGLHLKYRVEGTADSWVVTPLLHRDSTSFLLRDLHPNTGYEVQMEAAVADGVATQVDESVPTVFYTSPMHDDYAFNITLTADKVLVTSVELHWSGVPFPMHKYVNLYAVNYKLDTSAEPQTLFRPAKVEQVSLDELKPGNRYQIWMEAYLSNGDVRKSNTLELVTKPGVMLKPPEKERLEKSDPSSSGGGGGGGGSGGDPSSSESSSDASSSSSYYEALIAVAVVAAICVLGFVTLLVLLLRRQGGSTATPITAHKSQSAYDNPTYKPSYEGEIENGKTHTTTPTMMT